MPDAAWPVLPQILWVVLVLVFILIFRSDVRALSTILMWRLKAGAAVKLGVVDIGASYVSPGGSVEPGSSVVAESVDDGARAEGREAYYRPNRRLFLVHKVKPSVKKGQLFDVVIYVVPHKDATLASIQKVEYYFGPYWGNKVFSVTDRARGFPIATSAYGPFVCTAELYFTDGERVVVPRYIDFEMGGFQAVVTSGKDGAA